LLHGDLNGVTVVPRAIAGQVAAAAATVRADEADLMAYIHSPAFSIDGFFERKFSH
jgi:regulator of RNase E activity RraA